MSDEKERLPNNKKRAALCCVCGAVGGLLNGLFGSGAGIVCVVVLRRLMGDDRKAHATSTLAVFVMSIFSLLLYWLDGNADFSQTWCFLPGGAVGAVVGAAWLKNIAGDKLRRLFGGIIALSGAVMLLSQIL